MRPSFMAGERLAFLFDRFLNKTCSVAEKQELSELALMEENQSQLQALIEAAWNTEDVYDISEESSNRILHEILGKRPAKHRFLWIKRVAVAAAIAGLILGGYELLFDKKESQTPVAIVEEIKPGSNKAVLTLGNGTQIILDSQSNGALARQGNTKITKLDSGKLAYTILNGKTANIEYNTLSTPRGGEYQLILPDGTKAWLNAASSITYPSSFLGSQRLVKMTGEVYFEVVHNAKMPFVVKVNDQTIEDIGTSFNVNAYQDENEIKTTLIDGSVKISAANENHILKPGQQEILKNNEVQIRNDVDVTKVIAWQRGLFEFNQTSLPVIMRQVSRWYDVDVKYESPVSQETFGGGISRRLPLKDVLKMLEANGVKFRLEGKTLFVNYQPTK